MSALSWPAGLIPASVDVGLRRQAVRHQSQITSQAQAVELGTELWRMNVTMPGRARTDGGALESFFNQLVGGTQKVTAWHFGRPVPKGTMRGTPTLAAGAAQFARSLSLARVFGAGRRWDFNGSLQGWKYYGGNPAWGEWSSSATAAVGTVGLTGLPSGELLIEKALFADGEHFVGANGVRVSMRIRRVAGAAWYGVMHYVTNSHTYDYAHFKQAPEPAWDAEGWGVAEWDMTSSSAPADWATSLINDLRFDLYRTLPPSFAGQTALIDWIEISNGPGTYTPGTLCPGDMLGCSGQLFQVGGTDVVTADSSGNLVVPTVNRVRTALSSGAAVTWYRPQAEFMVMEDESAFLHGVGAMAPASFTLVEAP